MIVLKKHPYVLIAFEKEVIVLDVSTNSAEPIFSRQPQYKISDVKVSKNEEFMAMALMPGKDVSAKIEIYTINYEQRKFMSKKEVEGNNDKI